MGAVVARGNILTPVLGHQASYILRQSPHDALVAAGKLNVSDVSGKWEGYVQQAVVSPMLGLDRTLDIAGAGNWNYEPNPLVLKQFWRDGIDWTNGQDRLVTVGMRGGGDEPMSETTAITLLEKIVADQRSTIADRAKQPADKTPQMWALYKEVQDYYDQGMQVPNDVLLLIADGNWGNLRRLPQPGENRKGDYGVRDSFEI